MSEYEAMMEYLNSAMDCMVRYAMTSSAANAEIDKDIKALQALLDNLQQIHAGLRPQSQ